MLCFVIILNVIKPVKRKAGYLLKIRTKLLIFGLENHLFLYSASTENQCFSDRLVILSTHEKTDAAFGS